MKKIVIVAFVVAAALAACGKKKTPAGPTGPDTGSGSAAPMTGSGSDMGSGAGSGSAM